MTPKAVVIGLPVVVFAAGVLAIVQMVAGGDLDYADLLPAPDSIVWEEGDETTLWLQTNRHSVDIRIDSVSLGVGDFHRDRPESDKPLRLGRGDGCLSWVVSSLLVSHTADGYFVVDGLVSRNGTTEPLTVHLRLRADGASAWANFMTDVHASPDVDFQQAFNVSGVEYTVEASHDNAFPEATTRRLTVNTETGESTRDDETEVLTLYEDTGVGIVACSEAGDVEITLHGKDGVELNRYLVDIHADAVTPDPPTPDAGYATRRVCVDAADAQGNYLDGGETVDGVFDAADFGLDGAIQSATLTDVVEGAAYAYLLTYGVSGGDIQLYVSDAGASGFGLGSDRIYPVRLTATDDTAVADDPDTPDVDESADGLTASLDVGIWVDHLTLSPNDDGRCS